MKRDAGATQHPKTVGVYSGLSLLGSLTICLCVLLHSWSQLPWRSVGLEVAFVTLLRLRLIPIRRDAEGRPTLFHFPGNAVFVAALLHDGPATVMAVGVLSLFTSLPFSVRAFRQLQVRPLGDPFFFCVLFWLLAQLYGWLGGIPIHTFAEAGWLFQQPMAVLVPLLLASVVTFEIMLRAYLGLLQWERDGTPFRDNLRGPHLGLFHLFEALAGCLGLVLWLAWGWATLPVSFGIHEALLLSARSYIEALNARKEVEYDALTGLTSWRGLDNALRRRIAAGSRRKETFTLVFLDVDGLKRVNDTHGHEAGNELLRLVGENCRLHTRQHDMAARRGGDEFIILLDGLGRTEAEAVMCRLQRSIADSLAVHPRFGGLAGVSVGLAVYPEDAHDPQRLIEIADRQMYHNKRARKAARSDEAEGVSSGVQNRAA